MNKNNNFLKKENEFYLHVGLDNLKIIIVMNQKLLSIKETMIVIAFRALIVFDQLKKMILQEII